ncbi:MAG: NAD(P)/FAD-dependent oxidoreductase [Chitinophagaceae bacterium]
MSVPNLPISDLPRVVVVGGGFGGISLVKSLKNAPFQVLLIDRNNYHLFQPLLYQVSTAGLEPDSIAFPLRKIFDGQPNFLFRMAEVHQIDVAKNQLETSIGPIAFHYLVLATGSDSNFFGMEDIARHSIGMKSLLEAVQIRNFILSQFEKSLLLSEPEEIKARLTIVVTGGGPTGVELAGAFAELKKNILARDFPELPLDDMQIYLIEAGSRLLASMSPVSSQRTLEALEKLGVKVLLQTAVKAFDGHHLSLSNRELIHTRSLIWSAGVRGVAPGGLEENLITKNGRIQVDVDNRVLGYSHIFAIGDIAQLSMDVHYPKGFPMVAPVAMQQGENLGKNLVLHQLGQPLLPFRYRDK